MTKSRPETQRIPYGTFTRPRELNAVEARRWTRHLPIRDRVRDRHLKVAGKFFGEPSRAQTAAVEARPRTLDRDDQKSEGHETLLGARSATWDRSDSHRSRKLSTPH
jgi:hypothetical protein